MPGYRGHLVGGAVVFTVTLFGVLSFTAPSWLVLIEWLLFALAGSLFPDIDTKSKGQKLFYSFLFLFFIILIFKKCFKIVAIISVVSLLPLLVNHRALFHRLWFVILVPLVVAFLVFLCDVHGCLKMLLLDALFFILGAISHLWLDLGITRMFRW